MKTKLRKKLRKEAEKRYTIVFQDLAFWLYDRNNQSRFWRPHYSIEDLDALERELKNLKEEYVIIRIRELKKERELKRRGYLG